jgi:redox-sensing transcriptional repressor
MQDSKISDAVVHRLPKYYRIFQLSKPGNERYLRPHERRHDLNASQIRRDLNCFGGFGQGYDTGEPLKQEIMKILGIGSAYKAVIVGAGNIGQALLKYGTLVMKASDCGGV